MTNTVTLDERQQKGLIIAATSAIKQDASGAWVVPSQSLNGKYRVDGDAKTCSCPDFELRDLACKHVYAVEFVQRRCTFSMIKRKFGDSVRAKQDVSQANEVLLKILAHNIVVLIHEIHELGITPVFQRLIGCTETPSVAQQLPAI